MTLNEFAAQKKRAIFEDLEKGLNPNEGSFDESILKEARAKGKPQMGTTRYTPNEIVFEFIYPDRLSSSTVVPVHLAPPQRIVFLPIPSWVVESIWQGEIDGTYHFEADALRLVEEFEALLTPEANPAQFGPRVKTHRE